MNAGNLWDIFCRVIDNYGDIGVCWRLAVGLAGRGQQVRLWVDDASALDWMAPQGHPGVQVLPWEQSTRPAGLTVSDVLVEAFGCEIAPEFIAACAMQTCANGQKPVWINLEYLSAEAYAGRCHGLPSPVLSGPGAGRCKYFFYPGFSPGTGGLLREPDLSARLAAFDRAAWLRSHGIAFAGKHLVSLFCYEPAALGAVLEQWAQDAQPRRVLVTSGRASAAVRSFLEGKNRLQHAWNVRGALSFSFLPALTQYDFDHLLWACDLNFVRGEDSLVRALWAGKPFVWQLYPQQDGAHHPKLEAFLQVIQAPPAVGSLHRIWNGMGPADLPTPDLAGWQNSVQKARDQLLQQPDLVSQLLDFVQIKR